MKALLDSRPAPRTLLEIGCGRGTVMHDLRGLLADDTVMIGVDLLTDRLRDASGQQFAVARADGRFLPFRDGEFDLVVTFTMFSSILDQRIRALIAIEIERVLSPKVSPCSCQGFKRRSACSRRPSWPRVPGRARGCGAWRG